MAQDHFVKVGGNDSNDGHTWANAKATIASALAAATGTGDRVIIAPGRYNERGLAPAAAGTRTDQKSIIGDYASNISDGSATSGVTPGYVFIDGSDTNNAFSTSGIIAVSDNWAFWNFKGLYCDGAAWGLICDATTQGTVNDSITIEDCISVSWNNVGFNIQSWDTNPDTYAPITVKNSIFVGKWDGTSKQYNCGGIIQLLNKTTSFYTNPQVIFDRCIIGGIHVGVYLEGGSNYYLHVKFRNCTLFSYQTSLISTTNGMVSSPADANAYTKYVLEDCLGIGYVLGDSNPNATYTRCRQYGLTNGGYVTAVNQPPHVPSIPYLRPGSTVIDANGSNGIFPDLWGNAKTGDADFGAQEYVSGGSPAYPLLEVSSGTVVTGRTAPSFGSPFIQTLIGRC